MGPKKDDPTPRGLWISPRRWVFVLLPLLAVIAGGTFIRNSYVSEQFGYLLSEKFFDWPNNQDFVDEVGTDKNSAFKFQGRNVADGAAEVPAAFEAHTPAKTSVPLESTQIFRSVEGPAKVFGGDEENSKRSDDTASELAAVRAELAKSIAAEESARRLIAHLEKWLKDNEIISAGALDAERERSDGIARDLAAVRSELADRITAEASARNEIAQLTKRLEASENEWTMKLTAERGSDSGSLATIRAELENSITAEASARKEIERLTQRLATNEKDWTTKLDAEREHSHGLAQDLATVRAELAEHIAVEASARRGILDLEKLSQANATDWTKRSEGMARDLESVRAEDPKRIAAEASARPSSEFPLSSKTESAPNDRGYVRPPLAQPPIPLPRPAPPLQPQTAATGEQSPHAFTTEQPPKVETNNVRDARDKRTREAKQRRAADHPFGSVFDSVR